MVLLDWSNNTGVIDVKVDRSVLEEKSSFKVLGLTFSSKLDWNSYIISFAKTASKKIGGLIGAMKFRSMSVLITATMTLGFIGFLVNLAPSKKKIIFLFSYPPPPPPTLLPLPLIILV